jgi:putative addiction module killer protein
MRSLGAGVHELRIDHGPGYRVHFLRRGTSVILLQGGDKQTQRRDIAHAMALSASLDN